MRVLRFGDILDRRERPDDGLREFFGVKIGDCVGIDKAGIIVGLLRSRVFSFPVSLFSAGFQNVNEAPKGICILELLRIRKCQTRLDGALDGVIWDCLLYTSDAADE